MGCRAPECLSSKVGARGQAGAGVRAPGTEKISQLKGFLIRIKRRAMAFFERCPVGWGGKLRFARVGGGGGKEGARVQGGSKGFDFGGVTCANTYKKEE